MRTAVVLALATILVLGTARAAAAQAQPGRQAPPERPETGGRLEAYIDARHFAERRDPGLRRALESPGRLSAAAAERLARALEGSGMEVAEFTRVHRQVRADPVLREVVRKALAAQGAPEGSGGAMSGLGAPTDSGPGAGPGPGRSTLGGAAPAEPRSSR